MSTATDVGRPGSHGPQLGLRLRGHERPRSSPRVAGQVDVIGSPGQATVATSGVNGGMALAVTKGSILPTKRSRTPCSSPASKSQEINTTLAFPMWTASFDNPELTKSNPNFWAAAKTQLNGPRRHGRSCRTTPSSRTPSRSRSRRRSRARSPPRMLGTASRRSCPTSRSRIRETLVRVRPRALRPRDRRQVDRGCSRPRPHPAGADEAVAGDVE